VFRLKRLNITPAGILPIISAFLENLLRDPFTKHTLEFVSLFLLQEQWRSTSLPLLELMTCNSNPLRGWSFSPPRFYNRPQLLFVPFCSFFLSFHLLFAALLVWLDHIRQIESGPDISVELSPPKPCPAVTRVRLPNFLSFSFPSTNSFLLILGWTTLSLKLLT